MRIVGVGWLVLVVVVLSVCRSPSPFGVSARLSLRDRLSLEHSAYTSTDEFMQDSHSDQYLVDNTNKQVIPAKKCPKLALIPPKYITGSLLSETWKTSVCKDKKEDPATKDKQWTDVPTADAFWANKDAYKKKITAKPNFFVNIGQIYSGSLFGSASDAAKLPADLFAAAQGKDAVTEFGDLLNCFMKAVSNPEKKCLRHGESFVCVFSALGTVPNPPPAKPVANKTLKPTMTQIVLVLEPVTEAKNPKKPIDDKNKKITAWKVCEVTRPGAGAVAAGAVAEPAADAPAAEAAPAADTSF